MKKLFFIIVYLFILHISFLVWKGFQSPYLWDLSLNHIIFGAEYSIPTPLTISDKEWGAFTICSEQTMKRSKYDSDMEMMLDLGFFAEDMLVNYARRLNSNYAQIVHNKSVSESFSNSIKEFLKGSDSKQCLTKIVETGSVVGSDCKPIPFSETTNSRTVHLYNHSLEHFHTLMRLNYLKMGDADVNPSRYVSNNGDTFFSSQYIHAEMTAHKNKLLKINKVRLQFFLLILIISFLFYFLGKVLGVYKK